MKHHPLSAMLTAAAKGSFPPSDGHWHRVPPWRAGIGGVVAFTGGGGVAVDEGVSDDELEDLGIDGFSGAHDPHVLIGLAQPGGWIDCLDQLFVAREQGDAGVRREWTTTLVPRPDLAGHPRVAYARLRRDDVQVFGRSDSASNTVITLGRGTAGLYELSFELDHRERGQGRAVGLITEALALVPAGEVAVMAAAPGNAASIRSILRAGLVPVGSVQLFQRPR